MSFTNTIYCGDNLEVLPNYIQDESVDLIYIDPPFNSSRKYEVFWGEAQERRSFQDRFGDAMTYLDWMRPRIRELHRVLKPTGSFYYHCDWHASHYIKVELDRVFGFDSFQNEIVWKRTPFSGSSKARASHYPHSHDVILFYARGKRWTWNGPTTPYTQDYLARFKWDDGDGHGAYRKTLLKTYAQDTFERLQTENRLVAPKKPGARWSYKQYLRESSGQRQVDDVWTDINAINPVAKERLGYPTQKPLSLLERIVRASSNEGDVVLDAFCGCGTTLEAAAKHKRLWIGIDSSPTACRVMAQRLENRLGLKEGVNYELRDMPKTAEQLRHMPAFEFQNWAVMALGGITSKVKVDDYGIDGRLYLADVEKEHRGDFMELLDRWYPIQVKQKDKACRPDIDSFETAMRRDKRLRGYFIAFGFSQDAYTEIKRANTHDGLEIVPLTVEEILRHERVAGS